MIRSFVLAPLAIAVGALVLPGCSACDEPPLATLVRHENRVERDLNAQVGAWTQVAGDDQFHDGDGIRTGEASEATLGLAAGAKVRVEAATTIRFRRNAPNVAAATSVEVETGLATVEAGKESVGIKTRFGIAILSGGSTLRVDHVGGVERYRVDLGEAVFPTEGGTLQTLTQGQQIVIGLARLEPVVPSAASNTESAVVTDLSPAVNAGVKAASIHERSLIGTASGAPKDTLAVTDHADLELPLGGDVTVNDPAPPTAVGFSLTEACPEGGALEVERRRAQGKNLNVPLEPGAHSYRVFCFDAAGKVSHSPAARGSIRVRRATGSAQLPTTAPRNQIDVDGRRYTVMFQNLLPEIEVRWPNAPSASSYTMERTFNGQTSTTRSATPSVRLTTGQIPEGDHRLRFTAAGATPPASQQSMLSVRFDNAAPSVSLRAPPATGFEPGGDVHVIGVAIADTRVSILGNAVTLDRQHRFDTSVRVPSGQRAFAVRVEHPRTGVDYYLRRQRGAR